jgi:hypothetical protein
VPIAPMLAAHDAVLNEESVRCRDRLIEKSNDKRDVCSKRHMIAFVQERLRSKRNVLDEILNTGSLSFSFSFFRPLNDVVLK